MPQAAERAAANQILVQRPDIDGRRIEVFLEVFLLHLLHSFQTEAKRKGKTTVRAQRLGTTETLQLLPA
jgi:hypothetical protein